MNQNLRNGNSWYPETCQDNILPAPQFRPLTEAGKLVYKPSEMLTDGARHYLILIKKEDIFTYSFIKWFYKCLLRIYYVPSMVLEHRETQTITGKERKAKKVKSLSRVRLFATPWAVAYQNSPSVGFPRQESWSGVPFPSPGNLPDPGIKPRSPTLLADALLSEPPGKSNNCEQYQKWVLPVLTELKLKAWGKVHINQLFTTKNVKQQNHRENCQAKVGSECRARASLVVQMAKNSTARWEAHVWALGQEDPLEERLPTHSRILVWKIPRTEEPGGL